MRAALDRRTAKKWLPGAFEVCELHVHPDHQSQGLGRQLLHALVADLPHPAALLSTPDADTKAFRLYHADGFVDLARGYHFPGDAAPVRHPRRPAAPASARAGPGEHLSVALLPATDARVDVVVVGSGPQRAGRRLLPGPRRAVGRGRRVRRRPRRRGLDRRALARACASTAAPART